MLHSLWDVLHICTIFTLTLNRSIQNLLLVSCFAMNIDNSNVVVDGMDDLCEMSHRQSTLISDITRQVRCVAI